MMFGSSNEGKAWFRPRSFGVGSGVPVAWQGWALLCLHVALILGVTLLLRDKPAALIAAVLAIAILPMPIYAGRTEGAWRWRWGNGK